MEKQFFKKMSNNQVIASLNEVKTSTLTTPVTLGELKKKAFKLKVPYHGEFITELKRKNALLSVGNNLFVWANSEPLHKDLISNISAIVKRNRNIRYEKRLAVIEKQNHEKAIKTFESKINEKKVNPDNRQKMSKDELLKNAVSLLLKEGYRIMKPVITHEEIFS